REGAGRVGRYRGRPDRHLSRRDAGWLAVDRTNAGQAVRSRTARSVSDESRGCGAVLRNRPRRIPAPGASPMNAVYVLKPGMLTTVQDLGRWGYQSRGVPVAGP